LTSLIREFIGFGKYEIISYYVQKGFPMSEFPIGVEQALGRSAQNFADYISRTAATGVRRA